MVQGRVVEEGSGDGVSSVIVQLEGFGYVLTDTEGGYRFQGVEPGGYELQVMALGYAPESRFVPIKDAGAVIDLQLRRAPILLDTLRVSVRSIDLHGRVREADGGPMIVDAEVLSNLGRAAQTDAHGTFDLDDVYAEVPLSVRVRAFGYLPLDYEFVPDESKLYTFELQPDPVIQAMIDEAVVEIEDRASGRRSVSLQAMNREDLLKYDNATALDAVQLEYGARLSRVNVVCVVIDEKEAHFADEDLEHLLPQEIERIEFMRPGAGSSRLVTMRVYTRDFIRDMVAGAKTLHPPFMVGGVLPPLPSVFNGITAGRSNFRSYLPDTRVFGRSRMGGVSGPWMCG